VRMSVFELQYIPEHVLLVLDLYPGVVSFAYTDAGRDTTVLCVRFRDFSAN